MMVDSSSDQEQDGLIMYNTCLYPYYVQSPSTLSHGNTIFSHDPLGTLSHYSSSLGSNTSLLDHHHKLYSKKSPDDISIEDQDKDSTVDNRNTVNRLIIIDRHGRGDDEEEDDEDDGDEFMEWKKNKKSSMKGYLTFRGSDSCIWICLQLSWRVLVSLWIALLVFYIATKPPPPNISIKMGGIHEFGLGEGVDSYGVSTKILNCNSSIHLVVHIKSKLFGLHIHSPQIQMSFAHLPFAKTNGPELYAESDGSRMFELFIETKNKAMYGAGRNMEDLLESGKGLPLMIKVRLSSHFKVVWNIIKPNYHHNLQCLILLYKSYDLKHQTQAYNSTCNVF